MPTINDLRQQAATIKNATQVGENTATRVGTTFETIADLLEGAITIDAAPSPNSQNAVSSGGVYDAIEGGFYY